MNVIKKSVLSVFTFSSSIIFAGTMGSACKEGNITIPCYSKAWNLGVQALYLHPTYNNGFSPAPTFEGTATYKIIIPDPGWNWGFRLAGGYFYNEGSDFNLNWSHLNASYSKYATLADGFTAGIYTVDSDIQARWDAVNGEFGQRINLGKHKSIRLHGGVQFAQIVTNLTYRGTTVEDEVYIKSYGFGPRIGADMQYHIIQGLSLYANGATALLVSGQKYNFFSNTLVLPDLVSVTYMPYTTSVIPELEGKLGATYTHVLPQGHVTLDAGYWWINYLSAQPNIFGYTQNSSDFSINGPYFGIKWLG